MKKALCLFLAALCLAALSGCGSAGDVIDYGLVFVNRSGAVIVEVVVDFQDRNGGTRNADSSPLKRGETFGFEAGSTRRLCMCTTRLRTMWWRGRWPRPPSGRPRPRESGGTLPPGTERRA